VDVTIRGRIFALTYDRLMAKTEDAGLAAHRAGPLTGATGRVLERTDLPGAPPFARPLAVGSAVA
jgi:hypothetical protein